MKPVLIQTLMKKMRRRLNNFPLPNETQDSEIPTRRDRSGTFILVFLVLVIIAAFLM